MTTDLTTPYYMFFLCCLPSENAVRENYMLSSIGSGSLMIKLVHLILYLSPRNLSYISVSLSAPMRWEVRNVGGTVVAPP